jgi:D-psicose/D-tagatose/L-ribulose 3-epimerase
MIASEADGTGIEHIEKLAAMGFDYAELPLAEMMQLTEDKFERALQRIKNSGIGCEACNNFFLKTIRLTGINVNMAFVMDYVERALARAAALGAKMVVFGSGEAKNVPAEFSPEDGYQQVVELLKKIGPIARPNNIIITIEPLRAREILEAGVIP